MVLFLAPSARPETTTTVRVETSVAIAHDCTIEASQVEGGYGYGHQMSQSGAGCVVWAAPIVRHFYFEHILSESLLI